MGFCEKRVYTKIFNLNSFKEILRYPMGEKTPIQTRISI
jgi:hypothetical protein